MLMLGDVNLYLGWLNRLTYIEEGLLVRSRFFFSDFHFEASTVDHDASHRMLTRLLLETVAVPKVKNLYDDAGDIIDYLVGGFKHFLCSPPFG